MFRTIVSTTHHLHLKVAHEYVANVFSEANI